MFTKVLFFRFKRKYWATVSYSSSPVSRYEGEVKGHFFGFLPWLQSIFFGLVGSERRVELHWWNCLLAILPVTIIANCVVLAVETPLPNGDKTQLARDLVRHISSTCTYYHKEISSLWSMQLNEWRFLKRYDVSEWRGVTNLHGRRFSIQNIVLLASWLWSNMTLDFRHHLPWAQRILL